MLQYDNHAYAFSLSKTEKALSVGHFYMLGTNRVASHTFYYNELPIMLAYFSMLIEPKTVPIILKLCQHNWEEPSRYHSLTLLVLVVE